MRYRNLLAPLLIVASIGQASAALPTGSLSFLQPSGTALNTDNIEVWLRLTLDAASVPLFIDSTQENYGLTPSDFDSYDKSWLTISSAQTNIPFGCSGNFHGNICGGTGPYTFEWGTSTGNHNFAHKSDISLQPGQSIDYLFGTFKPTGGSVPAGDYTFYYSSAIIQVSGTGYQAALDANGNFIYDDQGNQVFEQATDDSGNPLFNTEQRPVYKAELDWEGNPVFDWEGNPVYEQQVDDEFGYLVYDAEGNPVYVQATDEFGELLFETVNVSPILKVVDFQWGQMDIASTNCGPHLACTAFVREVLAVPEPESYAMLLAGLGLIGVAARRRSPSPTQR